MQIYGLTINVFLGTVTSTQLHPKTVTVVSIDIHNGYSNQRCDNEDA